jgi:hypothetical protein
MNEPLVLKVPKRRADLLEKGNTIDVCFEPDFHVRPDSMNRQRDLALMYVQLSEHPQLSIRSGSAERASAKFWRVCYEGRGKRPYAQYVITHVQPS